ncbi:glycosyltransferase 87 family protein [Nocardia terpenica]|uniref:DUF2029 domain-containing protein n=1 Tax=Nocardia terpenica TaxID=455432 RepID=A0A6G9Z5Q2_9NOCA|nr:glycosyltransferase 87 family protein [Nocardia terpenica]QIS20496.1 DUF2029 domain-containing protein [Nocardia terpenica]
MGLEDERWVRGSVVAAVVIAVGIAVAEVALLDKNWLISIDFRVYHMGGSSVLHGISPYDVTTKDGNPFAYTPFAALVFVPLGLLSVPVALAVWTFVSMLALEVSIWLALGLPGSESSVRRARLTTLAIVAALPMAPVMLNIGVGQINALLMLLVLIDLVRRPGRTQGVALGIAAGIKLIPLLFIVYLLITRRTRAAVVAAATFAATVLLGFAVLPGPSVRWWAHLMLDTERMSPPGAAFFNQSMRGVLAHFPGALHSAWVWLPLAVLVGIAGLAISAWADRRGMAAAGVMACAATSLLISPIAWTFHWVWAAPALALWLRWARRRQDPAHTAGVVVMWSILVASGVLTFLIVARVPGLASADVLMHGTMTTIVTLNGLTMLAALGFLGALAAMLWRTDRSESFV